MTINQFGQDLHQRGCQYARYNLFKLDESTARFLIQDVALLQAQTCDQEHCALTSATTMQDDSTDAQITIYRSN